jgi:hypothetical protein
MTTPADYREFARDGLLRQNIGEDQPPPKGAAATIVGNLMV